MKSKFVLSIYFEKYLLWASLFTWVFLSLVTTSYSQISINKIVALHDSIPNENINYQELGVTIYEDTSCILSLDQIRGKNFELLKPKEFDYPTNSTRLTSNYWLKCSVWNQSHVKNWYIEFPDHRIDSLEAYILFPNQSLTFKTGDCLPGMNRFINHKNFIFPLPSHKNHYEVYFKIKASRPIGLILQARSDVFLMKYMTYEYLFLGIFYGSIFCVFMLNFFVFIKTRELMYLFYCGYQAFLFLYSSVQDGLFVQFTDLNNLPIYNYHYSILFTIAVTFQYLYGLYFLRIKENNSYLFNFILFLIMARILLAVYFCLFYVKGLDIQSFDFALIIGICLLGIYRLIQGFKPARLFVIGAILIFWGYFIHALKFKGLLVNNIITVYATQFGIFIEIIFLTLAFADRFRFEEREKRKAQNEALEKQTENNHLQAKLILELEEKQQIAQRVTTELETLVKVRTEEIQLANEKLRLQSEEIQQLNSKIDIAYYQVKQELSSTKKEKLFGVNFDHEFENEIKSEADCLQFLAKLKWSEGFECVKCKNDTYWMTEKPLHRKCQKCYYYIESPTANTILHKLKFPILSAFKIIFWTINERAMSLEEMSNELSVRVATISTFRSKVKNRIHELKKSNSYTISNLFLIKMTDISK